jgi:hypothetical protein
MPSTLQFGSPPPKPGASVFHEPRPKLVDRAPLFMREVVLENVWPREMVSQLITDELPK